MRKAASVFLCSEIRRNDVDNLVYWLKNPAVTRFLNEERDISASLEALADRVPEPMLGYHLNRIGRFLLIRTPEDGSIGFVKLTENRTPGSWEIVYAVGDDMIWGKGYGEAAIRQAVLWAEKELNAVELTAKIDPKNLRSSRLACACGFLPVERGERWDIWQRKIG